MILERNRSSITQNAPSRPVTARPRLPKAEAGTALRPQPSLEHAVKSRLVIISQKLGNVRQMAARAVSDRRLNGGVHEVHMMWFIFQSSIIFAVVASNIHWHWTPNEYLAALIGVGLAYGLTLLLIWYRRKD
jgi:hypothetical protein